MLIDVSHTCHTRARTGVQRVVRSLLAALGDTATPITHDPHAATWRPLAAWERTNLAATSAAAKRGAQWPLVARLRGRLSRFRKSGSGLSALSSQLLSVPSLNSQLSTLNYLAPLLVPEIFSPTTAAALPALFAAVTGPRVALFHDAIALKLPNLTPVKTVARFPAYLHELLAFDGIAAVSDDSRDSLLAYWRWLGAKDTPPVETIPLGIEPPCSTPPATSAPAPAPVVLCVASLEGRKNHLALLDACEALWQRGLRFELHLVGLAHPQTGAAALARVRALQSAGRSLRYDGPVSDAALEAAYARCTFTVYPSLLEGFGLPVLESLAHHKPCLCSAHGALGESARGGGTVTLDRVDAPSLAAALERLLTLPAELVRLAAEAQTRPLRTWRDYAADLTAWLRTLSQRN